MKTQDWKFKPGSITTSVLIFKNSALYETSVNSHIILGFSI